MAKKSSKKSSKLRRRGCPPCTEGAVARGTFSAAIKGGHCSLAERALDKINEDVNARSGNMTAGAKRLAFRELAAKIEKVKRCREKAESSDSNRFNGLLGLGFFGL